MTHKQMLFEAAARFRFIAGRAEDDSDSAWTQYGVDAMRYAEEIEDYLAHDGSQAIRRKSA